MGMRRGTFFWVFLSDDFSFCRVLELVRYLDDLLLFFLFLG